MTGVRSAVCKYTTEEIAPKNVHGGGQSWGSKQVSCPHAPAETGAG